ncbi:MAG TPA: hypothetical protein VF017_02080 [Thermoanaerobaculia bacterium]|nr:hypothetical protein [Thermoanaerobaculia bacterium]
MRLPTLAAAAALALVVAALPAAAQSRRSFSYDNAFRLSAGVFEPEGDSAYWEDAEQDFTGDVTDFEDLTLSIDYVRELRGNLRLVVGGSIYEGSDTLAYRDFVDNNDDPILHDTTLTIAAATLGLEFRLAPRSSPVVPYLGVGAGLYSWSLEESGDFVDFGATPLEIFSADFDDDGVATGYWFTAGLDVPVSSSFAFFVRGRWHFAEDDLEGDFEDLGELDLSGQEIAAGLSWSF